MRPPSTTKAGVTAAAAVLCAAALTAVWLRRRFVAVTVTGHSMIPTFQPGDRVLVRRAGLPEIRCGQVVVLAAPGEAGLPAAARARTGLSGRGWIIKRAAAVPGGLVPPELAARLGVAPGAAVPAGRLLVLGDNRRASVDSRTLGYIPGGDLLGVAVRRFGSRRREPGRSDSGPAPGSGLV